MSKPYANKRNESYRRVQNRVGSRYTEKAVKIIVEAYLEDCIEQVRLYGDYDIYGFGSFSLRSKEGREGFVPNRDGVAVPVYIPAYDVIKFTPCKRFKDIVNNRVEVKTRKVSKKTKKPSKQTEKLTIKAEREQLLEQFKKAKMEKDNKE